MGCGILVLALQVAILFVLIPSASLAQGIQTPVVTTFDQTLEGWTRAAGQNAIISHESSGGNPGGYARMTDGGVGRTDLEAPASYLGDWSALDGLGVLYFDHRIIDLGSLPQGPPYQQYEVVLEGGTNRARFLSDDTAQLTWSTAVVPIHEASWSIESGSWSELLSNVQRVLIRIELVGNDGAPDDEDGIDNIRLTGPSAIPVLPGLGLFVLGVFLVVGAHRGGPRGSNTRSEGLAKRRPTKR